MTIVTDTIGLHLDRQSLAIARHEQLSVEPVLIATERSAASPTVLGAQQILAALRAQLRPAPEAGARAVFAVPADFDLPAVARLARVSRTAGLDDVAYVDAAALTLAVAPQLPAATVLQMGWRNFLISRVRATEACVREAAWLQNSVSLSSLQDRWVETIAALMVKQTRFDPLHDRRCEQQLFAQLPSVLDTATRTGVATLRVESADNTFAVQLAVQHFEDAAATSYQTIIAGLLAAQQAGESLPCIVPQTAVSWPGFIEQLTSAASGGVFVVPDGLLARTARSLVGTIEKGQAVWRVARLEAQESFGTLQPYAPPRERLQNSPVTHAAFNGESLPISTTPLVVGRLNGTDQPAIVVPAEMVGVSRRHCTLVRVGDICRVIDHSIHGTWLNGARVVGDALVQAGDRIRVGMPGVEFTLISRPAAGDGAS